MPNTYGDLLTDGVGRIWNVYQGQFGSQHYQLLPERNPNRTITVHSEIGAMRMWIAENERHPELDEWRSKIPAFQDRVMSRQDELPKLYVPFEDNEVIN